MQSSAKNNSDLNENKQQNEVLANAVKKMANPSDFTPQLLLDMQILNENKICIVKKDGTHEKFNIQKIINAISKSAERMLIKFNENQLRQICNIVKEQILLLNKNDIDIKEIHFIVETALDAVSPKVAQSYRNYRNYKTEFVHMLDKVYRESQKIMYIGDKENSNADSALVSTKRSLIFNQLNKELYKQFFLNVDELQAIRDGYI